MKNNIGIVYSIALEEACKRLSKFTNQSEKEIEEELLVFAEKSKDSVIESNMTLYDKVSRTVSDKVLRNDAFRTIVKLESKGYFIGNKTNLMIHERGIISYEKREDENNNVFAFVSFEPIRPEEHNYELNIDDFIPVIEKMSSIRKLRKLFVISNETYSIERVISGKNAVVFRMFITGEK